jgi:hypothetical protein
VYLYRKAPFRRILFGSALLGCAVSFFTGMLASLNLGAV